MPPIQQFRLRQKLLRVMKTVGATEKLFTTEQILSYLAKYTEQKKLHDSKNIQIVRCKGDLLEELFGVQVFSIGNLKDVWQFIFPHIIPATNKEVQEHETECRNKQDTIQNSSDAVTSGRTDFQWMSQLPWWYFVEKNHKANDNPEVATASGSIVATSTAYVVDTDYETDSSISARPADNVDEDRFSLEYEPDSESSYNSDDTEPIDSDNEPYIPAPLPRTTEYDDTTTSTDTTDVSSMDCDIPVDDHWRCVECRTFNPPTVGYCQRCWKLRRGWLPDTSLSSPGLTKSFTLPPGQFTESFTPALTRSHTQPTPHRGIDVADSRIKKSSGENANEHTQKESSCNFDELPFNNKRKHDANESTNTSPLSKLRTTTSNIELSYKEETSTAKHTDATVSKSFSTPSTGTSSDSTIRKNHSSASNSQPKYYMSFPGLCNICHNNPNDATIVHGKFSHQYCCYRCAKKLQKRGKTCPVCRQPIAFVVKNYICHM